MMMIEGILRVRGTGMQSDPGAADLPWRVRFVLSAPEFMRVAFVCIHGGCEEYEFSAPSRDHIDRLIEQERPNVGDHPRFLRLEINGPNGIREEFKGYPPTRHPGDRKGADE
jgi:hypothetical protein